MKYAPGQTLYFPVNNMTVKEVRFVRYQGGRCVISFPSSGFERESRICVAESRLFPTAKAAEATIRKYVKPALPKASGEYSGYNWRRETRWDEPEDGWARH